MTSIEIKTPAETFPRFLSIKVSDRRLQGTRSNLTLLHSKDILKIVQDFTFSFKAFVGVTKQSNGVTSNE